MQTNYGYGVAVSPPAREGNVLVDKAFPDLQAKAKEQLALSCFLNQLESPQISFLVKQQHEESSQYDN